MNNWMIRLLCTVSALSVSLAQADENVFTPTNGPACTDRSRAEFSSWRCPGPGRYVAEFADEGNLAAVLISMPSRAPKVTKSITWRGAGRIFGEKLQWRVDNGRPVAAILRIWRTDTTSEGQEREVEELIVLRISIDGACRVASIDGRQRGANEIAERQSNGAGSLPCLEDW
jgi:hypothetical protein